MQKRWQYSFIFLSIWTAASCPLSAATNQLASSGQLSPGDITAHYPGQSGTYLSSPLGVVTGQNTLTYSLSDPSASFYRYDSNGQTNAFAAGTDLVDTNGAYGPYTKINFSSGVTEFGFDVQSEGVDTATFTLAAFDGSKELLTFNVGPIDNTSTRGQAAFLGAAATGGDAFTELRISSVSSDPRYSDFLVFGPATFAPITTAPVPEPSSIGLLGLLLGAFLVRKDHMRNSE